jgi:two-component system, OmpR family, KDP operon response regulator KdpE
VLVVDDEPAIRRFLKSALEVQGWATLEAASAAEGLRGCGTTGPSWCSWTSGCPTGTGWS